MNLCIGWWKGMEKYSYHVLAVFIPSLMIPALSSHVSLRHPVSSGAYISSFTVPHHSLSYHTRKKASSKVIGAGHLCSLFLGTGPKILTGDIDVPSLCGRFLEDRQEQILCLVSLSAADQKPSVRPSCSPAPRGRRPIFLRKD